ncbi:tetratricopeptide repeat-containing diguanylate cyclase [uncultured Pseudoalteromonas sp.]|uniref:tetratricopeptide repeat-containing diguanylate cyclase n=1 Tax=uncultured Pseudoalteromonas sp. TaxID=114053 RepID=UPI0025971787|nr:tetratricopeptide repeat-containing diguanylate cyclase [uncultured Pseudoalteromonas sp.]
MTNNIIIKINMVWFRFFVLLLFLLTSSATFANSSSLTSSDIKSIQSLLSDIKANKLDYLLHQKQLTHAYNVTKHTKHKQLHLEAAALYSELLFRQEQYTALSTHLLMYLKSTELVTYKNSHLLFLEAQLKLFAINKELSNAQSLANQLQTQVKQLSPNEKIIVFRAIAYYYTETDELKKTLSAALTGLELAIKEEDIASQGYFFRKIADAYNYLYKDDKEKAIYYAQKAVDAYEQTSDGLFTAKAYWSLGNVLLEVGQPKNALVYLNKALAYFSKVNMKKGLAFAQYSIANIQYLQGNYDTALMLANKNIALASSAGINDMHLASMILLSDIYTKQNLLNKANQVNDEVFLNLDKFSRSIYKADFLSKRYKLKRQLNFTEDAFKAIEDELAYTIKHYEATSETNIKTLQVKFEVKEKEDKILQLEYEKDINKLQATEEHQQKIIWRLSASIAFILVIVSLFLFYRQMRQRKKYHAIALTDYLTNSLNRRGILQKANECLSQQSLAIAIVDLDYFKAINDKFGHDIGDLVLIKFAQAAKDTLSTNDKFGRYGGEEWLFVLKTQNRDKINNFFENLENKLAQYCSHIEALPSKTHVTFSAGVAISDAKSDSLSELIKRADQQLYKAKENGRNQIAIA